MNSRIIIGTLAAYASMSIFFPACHPQVDEFELMKAGDNRGEIEQVIQHFKHNKLNHGYESAVFLINNMPYHIGFRGQLVSHYDKGFAEMATQPMNQRDEFYKQLNRNLGQKDVYYDYDIHMINSRQLISSITQATSVWNASNWKHSYDDSIFYNYVLPYKVSNEPISEWRRSVQVLYPRLGKNEVRSKRGPKIEIEEGVCTGSILEAIGASGKVVALANNEDSVELSINSERSKRKSLLLRYSCPETQANLRVMTNDGQKQIVNLVPSNDTNTFIYSQNIIDIDLKEGQNKIVLAYSQGSVFLDYLHLLSVESLPKEIKEGFALGSALINQKYGKALTFEQSKNTSSSSIVHLSDYDPKCDWQNLDICLRGYGSFSISPLTRHRDTLCLEAQYGNCHIGTRVSQYRFISSAHQLWTFIPTDDGKYRIMGRDSGLFLEAREEKGELRLFLSDYSSTQESQIWEVIQNDNPHSILYSSAIREAMKVYDYMHLWKWCACNVVIPPTSVTLLKSKTGNCHEEACFVVNICRYLGIPSAIDFTPHWGNRSQAHEWSVLIDEDGKGIPFYMGKIPGDTTNAFNGYKKPKVFRNRFAINKEFYSTVEKSKLPESWLRFPCFEDVTAEYGSVTDVERMVPDSLFGHNIAYVCVFDNRQWVPVFWGDIENGKVKFQNMARDIMYIAAVVNDDGKIEPFGSPFSIDNAGNIHNVTIDCSNKQSMTLLRKFPFLGKHDSFNTRMSRGRFQAANNAVFEHAVDLYYFTGITNGNWYEIEVETDKTYQYLRYIGPNGSYCNINELQFYDKKGKVLKGVIIGTQGKDGHTKETVFDGDILTGFDGISPDGHWVGIQLKNPSSVGKIRFIGRNDGNTIEVGDSYELFYWNDSKWNTVDIRVATDNRLLYDSVPANGLYVLKDRTKGWEERVFTYDNGEQIWW